MDNYNVYVTPVEERLEKAFKSKNGLYPHEILVLSFAPKYTVEQKRFPKYWIYKYGIYDVSKVLYSLFLKGFIEPCTVYDVLPKKVLPDIKDLLKSYNLSVTGRKAELITRVIDNIPEEDIERFFPEKYFALTSLGKAELEENKEILEVKENEGYFTAFDIDIWEANIVRHKYPDCNVIEMLHKKIDEKILNMIQENNYEQIEFKTIEAILYCVKNGKEELCLSLLSNYFYFFFNSARFQNVSNMSLYVDRFFPYASSTGRLDVRIKNGLAQIKHNLEITNEELEEKIIEFLKEKKLSIEIFTKEECAKIAILDMRNDILEIEKMADDIQSRYYQKYPKKNTNENENLRAEKVETIINNDKLSEEEMRRNEKKEKVLMESFTILKDRFEDNYSQIAKIMKELQKRQPEVVVEMWKFLLKDNWEYILNEKKHYLVDMSYRLTNYILKELYSYHDDFDVFEPYMINEDLILQSIFQYSEQLCCESIRIISTELVKKNFLQANKLMEYAFANKNNIFISGSEYSWKEFSYSDIFQTAIESYLFKIRYNNDTGMFRKNPTPDKEVVEFFNYWAEEVKDPTEKAKINIYLMDLI